MFDSNGDLLSSTGPAVAIGPTTLGGQPTTARPVVTYAYNGDGQIVTQTNAQGQTVTLKYNSFGEKIEEDDPSPDGGTTPGPVQQSAYDADGNLVSHVNAMGRKYVYQYNDRGERVEEDDPSPDGGQTPGPVWKWSYNAAGELVAEVDPMGRVSQWVHDGDGNVIQTIAPNLATGGAGDAGTTTYDTYDLDDEKTSETTPLPAGAAGSAIVTWQYDDLGDVTQETGPVPAPGQPAPLTRYFYNADQEQIEEIDPLGRLQTTTLDGLGRATQSTSFTGVTEQFAYDALSNLVTTSDASGTVTNSYDALGRETKTVDQSGGATRMGYSLLGDMTSLIDPAGNQTLFQFDDLNRETVDENQLGASDTYQYNAAGQVIQEVDKDGRLRTFEYDDLGRQTAEKWIANGGADATVNIGYLQHGGGGHVDTVQSISLPMSTTHPLAGTWTLTFDGQTTQPLGVYASAADVQNALAALPTVGPNSVTVSGGVVPGSPYSVQFIGIFDGQDVPPMSATSYLARVTATLQIAGLSSRNSAANIEFEGNDGSYSLGEQRSSGTTWTQIPYGSGAATIANALEQLFNDPSIQVQASWPVASVNFGEKLPATVSLVGGPDVRASYSSGSPVNESQILCVYSATGGTFKLGFNGQTTSAIAQNASAAVVQSALTALPTIGAGNVSVSGSDGGLWRVVFQGSLGDAWQPLLATDGSGLTAPVSVTVTQHGSSEPDAIESLVVKASVGSFTLTFEGDTTASIPLGAGPATVQGDLNALATVVNQQSDGDYGAVWVSGEGTAASAYTVGFSRLWAGTDVPLLTADNSRLVTIGDSITTSYDADGEITSVGDTFSHYAYTYNGQGGVASVGNAGTPGVPDVLLSSQYDAADNRSSLAATIGGTKDFLNRYSYDTLSRLVTMQQLDQTGGNVVAAKEIDYGYDAIGDVTRRAAYKFVGVGPRYDVATSAISYNALGLLTGISMSSNGGEVSLDNLTYSYDTLARVSSFGSIDGTATYGYDPTSQLTSASYVAASGHTEPPNFSVTFDPNGNRTSVDGTGTRVGADNHLTNDDAFRFQYDAAGNLLTRTRISTVSASDYKTTYSWDYRNRLTDVDFYNNSGVLTQHVHYVYGVWNNLIERDLDPNGSGTYTQIVHYVWDGNNMVLAFDGNDSLIARYLNGPNTSAYDQYDSTVAEEDVTSTSAAGPVSFPQLDAQGSVVDIANDDGDLADHVIYVSTGGVFSESAPAVLHIAGFQGGYLDAITGMEKFGARWTYTADAFWASQDPIGLLGGINLTEVDSNDPTNLSDPSGLWPGGSPPPYVRPPIHRRGTGPRPPPNQSGPLPGRGPVEGPVRIVPWYHNPIASSDAVDEIENDVLNRMAWEKAEQRMREERRAQQETARTLRRMAQAQADFESKVNGAGAPVTNEDAQRLIERHGRKPFPPGGAGATVGISDDRARAYVASCGGPITLRRVRRGEAFYRYANTTSGSGNFVTKSAYRTPAEADQALVIFRYGNSGKYRQRVVAARDTYVLESCVAGGTGRQTIILDPDAFEFREGVNTSTGLKDRQAGPPSPPAGLP